MASKTKSIWKYTLPIMDLPTIRMVKGAEILHVYNQGGDLCMWALVDPDETRREERTFRVAETGHILSLNKGHYIGSAHYAGGALVFHVFEVK